MQWQSSAGKIKVPFLLILLLSFQFSGAILNGITSDDKLEFDFDFVLIGFQPTTETTINSPKFVPVGDSVWWNVYTPMDTTDIHVKILGGNLTSNNWNSLGTARSFKIGYFSGLNVSNYELQVRYKKVGGSYSETISSTIEVFDRKLPTLYMDTDFVLDRKEHIAGKIRVDSSNDSMDLDWINAEINYRGGTSLNIYDKHNIAIETTRNVHILGMRKDDDWILTGDWLDVTQTRTRFNFGIYREISFVSPYVNHVDSRYVEVVLNGNYIGSYILSERIDRKFLDLKPWDDTDKYHSAIYKASRSSAGFAQSDVLYKYGWELKEPRDQSYWGPLRNISNFIMYSSDEEFHSNVFNYIERISIIHQYLLIILTGNVDSYVSNYYLYTNASLEPGLLAVIPWDFDSSLGAQGGRVWDPNFEIEDGFWSFNSGSNRLFERLFNNQTFQREILTQYLYLRESVWTNNFLLTYLEDLSTEIREAAIRNMKTWPRQVVENPDENYRYEFLVTTKFELNYETEYSYLRNWIIERLQLLDLAAIASLELLSSE